MLQETDSKTQTNVSSVLRLNDAQLSQTKFRLPSDESLNYLFVKKNKKTMIGMKETKEKKETK